MRWFEREMLGLYVSDHPLPGLEHILAQSADITVAAPWPKAAGEPQSLTLAGILSSVNRRVTKAGAPWAQAQLEDLEGSIEVMFFPQTYANVAINVVEDGIVAVKGRTDARDDTVKLIASESCRWTSARRPASAAPSGSRWPRPGAPRRWSTGSKTFWPPIRAPPTSTYAW